MLFRFIPGTASMGPMGSKSSTLHAGDWDGTYAAIVVTGLEGRADLDELAELLHSLAVRGTTIAVLDPLLGARMSAPRAGPGETYLLVIEDGFSVVEVTENGVRPLWIGDRVNPGQTLDLVLDRLSDAGIHAGHTVVVGTDSAPVEVDVDADICGFLREQVSRIDNLRLPILGADASWAMSFDDVDVSIRVRETLCALANGNIGARGSAEEEPPGSDPLLVAAGVYDDQSPPALLEGPRWTQLPIELPGPAADEWILDMRGGVLARRREMEIGTLATLRFASLQRPGCAVLCAEGPSEILSLDAFEDDGLSVGSSRFADADARSTRGGISASASERVVSDGGTCAVERVLAYESASDRLFEPGGTREQVHELSALGSHRLLSEHRRAWAQRWRRATVSIGGDPQAELAVRFALFHLLGSAATIGEAAVGARGLTGRAYRGHVFWDTDVFVLPVLCAVLPDAARAILQYRVKRLPQAMEEARRRGLRGARFPWESADDGRDVTPSSYIGTEGETIPIRTGRCEEHIVADVAWAARHYSTWTGDWEFLLRGPGHDLIDETARYWASRIWMDTGGRGHIEEVIGPDEYHELVDDNAFTNVMARANLRWAAAISHLQGCVDASEVTRWSELADCLVDGYDEDTRIYEQFRGYDNLKPLLIDEIGGPPIAADLMLGREAVEASQLIKQADVLMLHHMVPEEVAPGSLGANLDHYLPRTAHASSLSPAIHASLLARAGRVEDALWWFRLASRLDLDDLTGTTAGGIHLANMGGLWQALTFGFMGLRVSRSGVELDPRLPEAWSSLRVSFTALHSLVDVHATPEEVRIESDSPLLLSCGTAHVESPVTLARFAKVSGGWKETK
jgi:trehalose/maltose hydrolase-like predicted phosphorylase